MLMLCKCVSARISMYTIDAMQISRQILHSVWCDWIELTFEYYDQNDSSIVFFFTVSRWQTEMLIFSGIDVWIFTRVGSPYWMCVVEHFQQNWNVTFK